MPPLDSSYIKMVHKTGSYTILPGDDQIDFTIAAPATATLPFSRNCSLYSKQNKKRIINNGASALTVAAQAGDTLIGATAPGATTLAAGETAYVAGNGVTVWNITGGSGASGVSGSSGASGVSGFSGISGGSGASGVTGASGTSGFSGVTGASGASGASGKSGFSGASGAHS